MTLTEEQLEAMSTEDQIKTLRTLLSLIGGYNAEETADYVWDTLDSRQKDSLNVMYDGDGQRGLTDTLRALLE